MSTPWPETDRLSAFRDAVVADFRAFLPDVREIEAHFGPFDLDELKAFVVKAPAVRVSIVGSAPAVPVSTREMDVQLHCAAYIVTRASARVPADVAALSLAEQLIGRLARRAFVGWCETPDKVKLENHYSGKLRETGGVALFSVDWHQVVRVGSNVAAARAAAAAGAGAENLVEVAVAINGGQTQPLQPGDEGW